MQKLTNEHFRFRVFAFNTAHVVASGFLIMHISHTAKLMQLNLLIISEKKLFCSDVYFTVCIR